MPSILSTKKLLLNQRELLLNAGFNVLDYNALDITPTPYQIPENIKNIIITSQNAAKNILDKPFNQCDFYVVGTKTAALLTQNNKNVIKIAQHSTALATYITETQNHKTFFYFCGTTRRDQLPDILKKAAITCTEIPVYQSNQVFQHFAQQFDGILFYSPLGVEAFAKANTYLKKTTAFCIGETTAITARNYFKNVRVANATTVESVIAKAVKILHKKPLTKGTTYDD